MICEGEEDKRFFCRLIEEFAIQPFHIEAAGSKDSIGNALESFKLSRKSHYDVLTDIVLVGDNDDDPKIQFDNICAQLNEFWGSPIAPAAPLVRTTTTPRFTVLMLPWSEAVGNLECLCCDGAREANGKMAAHVDAFLETTKVDRWQEERKGKAWLRTNLAIRSYKDPFAPLGQILSSKKWNYPKLIRFDKSVASFKRIADELLKI